jgi:hypothetical protein
VKNKSTHGRRNFGRLLADSCLTDIQSLLTELNVLYVDFKIFYVKKVVQTCSGQSVACFVKKDFLILLF